MFDLFVSLVSFGLLRLGADLPSLFNKMPADCVTPLDLSLDLLPPFEAGAEVAQNPHHTANTLRLARLCLEVVLLQPGKPFGPFAIVLFNRGTLGGLLSRSFSFELALGCPQLPHALETAANLHQPSGGWGSFETQHPDQ